MPLCRPPLAALATLEFTWIYNDFFWALVLMQSRRQAADHVRARQPSGRSSSPTTTSIAAACLVAALPTLIVYFVLQKQFIGGLTLGSTKG